jgi:hypothetical protein
MAIETRQGALRDRFSPDVIEWRRRRLLEAGFDADLVERIAPDCRFDLHALIELVEHGCPPPLAVRILEPFEHSHRPC